MKTKLSIILLVLLSFACKKKKTSEETPIDTSPLEKKYRIKQITYSNNDKSTYEYNDKNQITKILQADASKTIFTYNTQGKLTKSESSDNINPLYNYNVIYNYDNAGLRIEQISTRSDGTKNKTAYTINNGATIGHKYYNWNAVNNTWTLDSNSSATYILDNNNRIIRYNFKNNYSLSVYDDIGNILTRKSFQKKTNGAYYQYYVTNRTYDDKKFIDDYPEASSYKVNNILDANYTYYFENGTIDTQQSNSYTYEYNESGYVTKQFSNGNLQATYTLEAYN